MNGNTVAVDLIEELRLRRWAREHYVPSEERSSDWHPIILTEMQRRDEELERDAPRLAGWIVPLFPASPGASGAPHRATSARTAATVELHYT